MSQPPNPATPASLDTFISIQLSEMARRLAYLIEADRELTPTEQEELTAAANTEWAHLRPMAAGVLTERRRLRDLYLDVERATGDAYIENMERFRAALGLS